MMHVINAPGRTMCTMLAWAVNTASASNFRHRCSSAFRHRCSSAVTTPILVEATDERQDKKFLSVPGDR